MNLLQNLFTPESLTDIFFLKYGLFFSLLIILPFLSLLIGSLLFSLLNVAKSKIHKNSNYFNFAKYSIELLISKMWMRVLFGVLPFFGAAFFYTQLFTANVSAAENLLFAFLLFFAGLCISVVYKGSFKLKENSDKETKHKTFTKSGWFALLLLLISSYTLISYLQSALVTNLSEKNVILGIMFSATSILTYLLFLAISFSITSAVIIVRLNKSKKKLEFYSYGQEFSAKTGILFTYIQPLFYVLYVVSVSSYALSFSFFFTSLLILLIMLLISVQFYIRYRNQNLKNTSIVFLFILLFTVLIYNNQLTSEKVKNIENIKQGKVFNIFS